MNIQKSQSSFLKALDYAEQQKTDPNKYNVSNQRKTSQSLRNIQHHKYGLPYDNIVAVLPQIKHKITLPSVDTFCKSKGYTKLTNPQSLKQFSDYSKHVWPFAPPSSLRSSTLSPKKSPTQKLPTQKSPTQKSPRKQPIVLSVKNIYPKSVSVKVPGIRNTI